TDGINDEVHKKFLEIGRLIEDRCREFAVEGEVTAYHPGPVVTTFEFKPSAGVKYAKVVNLGDDLALALKAESIRIERISGSSTVGIDVPNRRRELITLRDSVDTDAFASASSPMSSSVISSRRRFGTSMPTVDEPLMRSMRIDSALSASARSSPRLTTFAYFTPADGLNSNVVTTGPGW